MTTNSFSGITTPEQVVQGMQNGSISQQNGATILNSMAANGTINSAMGTTGAVPPLSLSQMWNSLQTTAQNTTNFIDSKNSGNVIPTVNQVIKNPPSLSNWLQTKIGDMGFMVLGGALIVGALLIANRSTVIKLGELGA